MRKLAAGNWKMNGTGDDLGELRELIDVCPAPRDTDIVICPPATLLWRMARIAAGSSVAIGGQDCHAKPSGAHTGDISAEMLRDAGADYVILGHSERRTDHRETDAMVRAKCIAATEALLYPVVCIGETLEQRNAGQTMAVLGAQLDGSLPDELVFSADHGVTLVLAYEPVWAIGSGLTPTMGEIAEAHDFLRSRLINRFGQRGAAVRILYGGSVKASNAAEIFAVPHVNGALVGGASLKAADFARIVQALAAA